MLVVSDTSPIRALSALDLLSVLHALYGELLVPPSVARELAVSVRNLGAIDVSQLDFVRIQEPTDQAMLAKMRARLDAGEAEAITLAIETHAEVILIDEARGRKVAASLGLRRVGVIGILLEAKKRGIISQVAPSLETLDRTITFRLSAALKKQALEIAGE